MNKRPTVHLLTGDDEFPLNMAARQIVDELLTKDEQVFGFEIVDGRANNEDEALATIKRCHQALFTPGFLCTRGKVVWWRDVTFLGESARSQTELVRAQVKTFMALLVDPGAGDNTLIISTSRIDRRSTVFKLCSERFRVAEFNVPEKAYLAERQTRAAIHDGLQARGLKADRDAEEMFLSKVGSDARQIASETEKLALYVQGRTTVTISDVTAIVSTSSSSVMWDLQDAVGSRDLVRALGVLQNLLAARESPIAMIVSMAARIRDLMFYREGLDRGWLRMSESYGGGKQAEWSGVPPEAEEVLSAALRRPVRSIHPFAAGKLAVQARHFTLAQLKACQKLALAAHETLVSSSVPQAMVIELLLIRMLGKNASRG